MKKVGVHKKLEKEISIARILYRSHDAYHFSIGSNPASTAPLAAKNVPYLHCYYRNYCNLFESIPVVCNGYNPSTSGTGCSPELPHIPVSRSSAISQNLYLKYLSCIFLYTSSLASNCFLGSNQISSQPCLFKNS